MVAEDLGYSHYDATGKRLMFASRLQEYHGNITTATNSIIREGREVSLSPDGQFTSDTIILSKNLEYSVVELADENNLLVMDFDDRRYLWVLDRQTHRVLAKVAMDWYFKKHPDEEIESEMDIPFLFTRYKDQYYVLGLDEHKLQIATFRL